MGENLHYRNWQLLKIKDLFFFFRKLVVKLLPSHHWYERDYSQFGEEKG